MHCRLLALTAFPIKERNIHYVVEIEVWLAKTMEFILVDDEDDIQWVTRAIGT